MYIYIHICIYMFVQMEGSLWNEAGNPVRQTWSGGKSAALKMHYANQ